MSPIWLESVQDGRKKIFLVGKSFVVEKNLRLKNFFDEKQFLVKKF